MMSEVSNNDLDFLATMNGENGLLDMYRKHPTNKDGTVDWACGLNSAYHKDIIKRIKDKSASEQEIVEYCYKTYKQRPSAFYAYFKRNGEKYKFYLNN